MISPLIFGYCLAFFLCAMGGGLAWRTYKMQEAQKLLLAAKKEAQEIAQLPLNNPYPLVQITKKGKFIFANPAALIAFDGIGEQGGDHPVLSGGLQAHQEREISYQNRIYYQTVMPAQLRGEETLIVYCYDITTQKQAEIQLQKAYQETEQALIAAERAKEARGQFLANMSHELRTPMNGIIGLSDILVETGLEGEKQDLIDAVNSSARSLLILLNDILDFSKIEAGELTVESIAYDIRKTVRQIEALQTPVASQKGLVFEVEIADHVPRILMGDPARLQQILNNLLSNALKFTDNGQIVLRVDGKKRGPDIFDLEISVSDTGIGIPKDKQSKIFEKFQQADASTARKYGGTGLGLAITKDLTRLMGGDIHIQSEENKGTVFTVHIPGPVGEIAIASEGKADLNTTNADINIQANVMIVDDHPVNLLFLRQVFQKLGFQNFDEAKSGMEALNLSAQKQYDLILMDCQMPEMDGFETTRRLREKEYNQRSVIIAVTADAMKGAQEKCITAGMDDYISKPVDKDKLKQVLAKWIPAHSQASASSNNKENSNHLSGGVDDIGNDLGENNFQDLDGFDLKRLHEFTDGNKEIEKEILGIFLEALKEDMLKLQQSFSNQNYKGWDSHVHKIYGSCSHVGATAMADMCEKGQTLYPDETDRIPDLHKGIHREYERICTVLGHR